jgi:tight adherence protein B
MKMKRLLRRLRRIRRMFIALAGMSMLLAGVAVAQSAGVRIREAVLGPEGSVRLVVSVTGEAIDRSLSAADFKVSEEGQRVRDLEAQPLLESKTQAVSAVLVFDTSGSTKGKPLSDAKTAAKAFVENLPHGVQMALVSFGPTATLEADFTTDRPLLFSRIDGLQAAGETALYDAVAFAASKLEQFQGQRNVVLFSDGGDTVSRNGFDVALTAVRDASVSLTSVGLVTPESDQAALDRLAQETGGRSLPIFRSAELAAAFLQVAKDIASQYVLTYKATRAEPKELDISVSVAVSGAALSDSIVVLNPRTALPPEVSLWAPQLGFVASRTGLYLSLLVVFLAAAMLTAVLLPARRVEGPLVDNLLPSTSTAARKPKRRTKFLTSDLGHRALEFVEKSQRLRSYREKLQRDLERAGWAMRASEFLVLRAAATAIGFGAGVGLLKNALIGIFLSAAAAFLPRLFLSWQIRRRSAAFAAQLPDTLQMFSGSLEAGYGLMQVIDTVTKDSSPPTSNEFARVLAETRLGMSVEDSLDRMVERIGDEDFGWVVVAIKIQRQAGGNLAALLASVAGTLRERAQLRRQVKVLSAEGKISAYILIALPFAMAAYMSVVNPDYLSTLTSNGFGRVMIIGALALMGAGIVWMRKIVRIEI